MKVHVSLLKIIRLIFSFVTRLIAAMRRRIRGILMSGKQFSLDSHLDLVQGMETEMSNRPISEPTAVPALLEDSNEYEQSKSGISKLKSYTLLEKSAISLFQCVYLSRKKVLV